MTRLSRILEVRFELDSVRERVRDIEWRFANLDPFGPERDAMINERQRALDKLRKTKEEMLRLEVDQLNYTHPMPTSPPTQNNDPNYGGTK
jgi:hypothetical protein|tara:strand:+ start:934 stop:1206 length:273 start_codon:yes stop_codon:yes gene_type:complete